MIDILTHHIDKSMSYPGDFVTPEGLRHKVGERGELLPYEGNTVVFLLEEDTGKAIGALQEELYRAAPRLLAEPLVKDSFHMTLHSLVDGPGGEPGLREKMSRAEAQAREIMEGFSDPRPLHMKATWMFNMAHTSIVLGLRPVEEDWQRLDDLYMALEPVRPLGYAMTPHITLAYFRPGRYTQQEIAPLRDALRPVEMDVMLRMEALVLQNFWDMNSYETLIASNLDGVA